MRDAVQPDRDATPSFIELCRIIVRDHGQTACDGVTFKRHCGASEFTLQTLNDFECVHRGEQSGIGYLTNLIRDHRLSDAEILVLVFHAAEIIDSNNEEPTHA